jgi:hypothetical protein
MYVSTRLLVGSVRYGIPAPNDDAVNSKSAVMNLFISMPNSVVPVPNHASRNRIFLRVKSHITRREHDSGWISVSSKIRLAKHGPATTPTTTAKGARDFAEQLKLQDLKLTVRKAGKTRCLSK